MEFALVFLVFFAVLYAILTYGVVFTAQQSINLAAQDGARLMLRVQPDDAMSRRVTAARAVAKSRVQWIEDVQGKAVTVSVCGKAATGGVFDCINPALLSDQVEVRVSYAYGSSPLLPSLPLLGSVLMSSGSVLSANSIVQLGFMPDAAVASVPGGAT